MANPVVVLFGVLTLYSIVFVFISVAVVHSRPLFIDSMLLWMRTNVAYDFELEPFAFVVNLSLTLITFWISLLGAAAQPEGLNNSLPRDQKQQLSGIYRRAYHAHINCIEQMAPLLAAQYFAYKYSIASSAVETAMCLFICGRLLFVLFYLLDLQTLRSIAYMGGATSLYSVILLAALPSSMNAWIASKSQLVDTVVEWFANVLPGGGSN